MTIKEAIERLKKDNPYPADVFGNPDDKELDRAAIAIAGSGMVPDRIFAKWGRKVWENCINRLIELTQEDT